MNWWQIDTLIMVSYGFIHSCLTTRPAMKLYEVFFPEWSWNIGMCVFSAATLALGIFYWQPSGHYIYVLIPGSPLFHFAALSMVTLLGLTIYCFRYTSTFWQWLGAHQLIAKLRGQKIPAPYRMQVRRYQTLRTFPPSYFSDVIFLGPPDHDV